MGNLFTEITNPLTIVLLHSDRQRCPPWGTQSFKCYVYFQLRTAAF